MPLYEYRCLDCGENVEVIQKHSDEPLVECKHCGGTLERLLSAPAIQFKGSGWYITDYARKNGASSNGSDKHETTSSKDKASTKESAAPASDTKTSSTK
jgi:putative FmdB family regulatory protein